MFEWIVIIALAVVLVLLVVALWLLDQVQSVLARIEIAIRESKHEV